MGIGGLLHNYSSNSQVHDEHLDLKLHTVAQMRRVEALYWVLWCMGVPTAH